MKKYFLPLILFFSISNIWSPLLYIKHFFVTYPSDMFNILHSVPSQKF